MSAPAAILLLATLTALACWFGLYWLPRRLARKAKWRDIDECPSGWEIEEVTDPWSGVPVGEMHRLIHAETPSPVPRKAYGRTPRGLTINREERN